MHQLRQRVLPIAVLSLCVFAKQSLAQTPTPTVKPTTSAKPTTSSSSSRSSSSEFPPYSKVLEGFEKVTSTADGKKSFYTLWVRKKDQQVYAELPASYAMQKHFFALTISSGDLYAGLQAGDWYVYWRRYNKRLALMEPNIGTRSTGDSGSKSSVKRLFTDRLILDVPIVTLGPGRGPIIDMDSLLVGQATRLFQGQTSVSPKALVGKLFTVKKAKAFEKNVELAFEVPGPNGRLQTLHYSISLIPDNTGYKPRVADQRVGYFTTAYDDLGKYNDEETRIRYITRWHLEKDDPKLSLSPPKKAIEFYIEHTTPVRYRRWVEQGVLYWNNAFAKIGIDKAIKVHLQNAKTGEHMEKDPEDVNYNFIRWLNNNIGTAIGPSRIHPLTGQILDADVVLTDGWIRHYRHQFDDILPKLATQGFGPRVLAWLADHPEWDPRLRLAAPMRRRELQKALAAQADQPLAGHPLGQADPRLIGDQPFDGLFGRTSQVNGYCMAAEGKKLDMGLMQMHIASLEAAGVDTGPKVDGMPEAFVGPLIAELVAHEVGHTLGLRHNFKSSSVYSMKAINSDEVKGKKPLAGSVMDYLPINICVDAGEKQGDYTMIGIGPYDYWAIEYGYTFAKDLKPILGRVAEPELAYATDEDTFGPDPLARRYDFTTDPLDYAANQMRIVKYQRERLLKDFVKDGESWSKARRGYLLTLSLQMRSVSMMGNWLGGAFLNRDKKGDKNGRPPVEVVPIDKQRKAMQFVIDNTFVDSAFGLNTDLLNRLALDKWIDDDASFRRAIEEPIWPIHEKIMGMQASALTMLMNPTTLERVYDNEMRIPADQDAVTLPELLGAVTKSIWTELDQVQEQPATPRKPAITSLRRNVQREYLQRLIDLSFPGAGRGEVYKPISNLAGVTLKELQGRINKKLEQADKLDAYSKAHLSELGTRIDKALNANYIYNARSIGRR